MGVHQGVYCSENGCEEPGEAFAGRLQPDSRTIVLINY